MERNKLIISSVLLLVIGFYGFMYWLDNYVCYTEYRVLTKQYFDNTTYLGGGNCTQSCLFMETIEYDKINIRDIHNVWFLDNYSKYQKSILYFANEHKIREDLENGNEIAIRWCPTPYGDRIRGIQ